MKRTVIDWHTHVLPKMDDGSKDVPESVSLIQMLSQQGIRTVVATPHFCANDESVDSFLLRRSASYATLCEALPEDAPHILLGAEVRYYPGIAKSEGLKKLRIEGTNILLLEMPMVTFTEYTVRELLELANAKGITLVMAHIERYLALQKPSVLKRLLENGVLMQVNASFFTSLRTRRKAISMLRDGEICFVGSDCHNLSTRPPVIGTAYEIIQKKFGEHFLAQMKEYGNAMLHR